MTVDWMIGSDGDRRALHRTDVGQPESQIQRACSANLFRAAQTIVVRGSRAGQSQFMCPLTFKRTGSRNCPPTSLAASVCALVQEAVCVIFAPVSLCVRPCCEMQALCADAGAMRGYFPHDSASDWPSPSPCDAQDVQKGLLGQQSKPKDARGGSARANTAGLPDGPFFVPHAIRYQDPQSPGEFKRAPSSCSCRMLCQMVSSWLACTTLGKVCSAHPPTMQEAVCACRSSSCFLAGATH